MVKYLLSLYKVTNKQIECALIAELNSRNEKTKQENKTRN